MSDLIRREDAIKALGECPLNWTDTAEEIQAVQDWECHKAAIEAVSSATDEEFEWCHDCKEYDQEKHCCHRWTKVIRNTVAELKAGRPSGKWKVINKTINTTLVACSECGKRFHIPNYCFKSERDRWKCCPICCADMKGADNE